MGIRRGSGTVLAIAAAGLLLVGCTGGEPQEPESTKPPKITDAPTTPEEWLAIAESQKSQWDSWTDGWESAQCGSIDELETASVDCSSLVYSAVEMATFAEQTWTGLTTPGAAEFISVEPPEEVAELVTATQDAATKASEAGTAWVDAECGIEMKGDCQALATTLGDALTAFDTQLAAWNEELAAAE